MTRDEIIELAREAGFNASVGKTDRDGKYHPNINALSKDVPVEWIERFAALVAAAERKRIESEGVSLYEKTGDIKDINTILIQRNAIRAMSQQ